MRDMVKRLYSDLKGQSYGDKILGMRVDPDASVGLSWDGTQSNVDVDAAKAVIDAFDWNPKNAERAAHAGRPDDATLTALVVAVKELNDQVQKLRRGDFSDSAPASWATSALATPASNATTEQAISGPVITAPSSKTVANASTITFSGGDLISIAHSSLTGDIQVSLTVGGGTLTLSGTTGLSFAFTADNYGTAAGDGTGDATMVFRGSLTNVNNALSGMVYTPTTGVYGTDTLTITVNDLANSPCDCCAQTATRTVSISVYGLSSGPRLATVGATSNSNGGTADWPSPNDGRITADDGNYAIAAGSPTPGQQLSYYLFLKTFGFNLPSNAIIDGILFEVKRKATAGTGGVTTDNEVRAITADGTLASSNLAQAAWATTEGWVPYGGPTELWGATWAHTDINDADFGLAIAVNVWGGMLPGTTPSDAQVNTCRCTVYYHT